MRVVVDTNIVVGAAEENLQHLRVLLVISAPDKDIKLVFDYEHKLQKEYERNTKKAKGYDLYRKWYKELVSNSKICWANGKLDSSHSEKLIHYGLHEPEDHIVVALAAHTDRYIITEDSDFGVGDSSKSQLEVLAYLRDVMGITVHSAAEALPVLEKQFI